MQHLPLFERGDGVRIVGGAVRKDTAMLFSKALVLRGTGDSICATVHGRQIGIIFLRHEWSGEVEITIGEHHEIIDLFASPRKHWIYERTLPSGQETSMIIRPTGKQNTQSGGSEIWIQTIYTSEYLTSEVEGLIREHVSQTPYTDATLNQLTDVFKWFDPEWMEVQHSIGSPPYQPPDFVHRKSWEWTQCIYGLDVLGMLKPEHTALGVGVGWEPLSYYLSNVIAGVVATDLYPVADQWSESGAREGNPEILDDPDKFAPYPYHRERIRFIRMDGKQLDFPDESFDIVWSCSSIEHFGGHAGAAQSMREIERVLKPGGVVVMITEYVLPDPETGEHSLFDPEYFNLRCVYEYLIRPVPQLELVQRLDLSIPDYYVRRAVRLPDEAGAPHEGSTKPHIVLHSPSGAIHTSIAMFFRKRRETGKQPNIPSVTRFTKPTQASSIATEIHQGTNIIDRSEKTRPITSLVNKGRHVLHGVAGRLVFRRSKTK